MKKTRVLLVEDDPLMRTTVRLALESLGYTIVGVALDQSEALRMLTERTPHLVIISPSVLEKTGMGLVREVLAKKHVSVLVRPGHPQDQFVRALSLLRPADRLIAVIRVVQTLFGCRHFVLN